jgi:mRNA interferase MazF
MEKGDIVLIPFPFTDLKGNKNRPALILITSELDITVSFISTQLKWKEKNDVELKPSSANGLKRDSLLRLSKLATIDKDLALGKLGSISKVDMVNVNQNLRNLLQLD